MFFAHVFCSPFPGDAVRAVNSHPHKGDQHQDTVKPCGEEDLTYSDFDMSCSTPTEDSVRDLEADATPHSFCCSQPERVISPVSLDMTSKRQTAGAPPSAGPKAAPPSAGPIGGSRRRLESSHACAETPDRGRSPGSRDRDGVHHRDEVKGERVKETGTAETRVELYPPQPEGTLSASAGEDAEGGGFADSLQTPRFRQNTHGSLDLDEPTLMEIPALPASNFAPKLNNEKHRSSSSDDEEAEPGDSPFAISKEQSSLGLSAGWRNLQFSNTDSQESYKRAGETTKREHSSLELNVNHCGSSQESVTGGVAFNDSLLTPSFPDSDEGDGEDCEATTEHEAQAVVSVRKRSPSSILHPRNEKIFIDDLHTPVFLKNVQGESSSAGNC